MEFKDILVHLDDSQPCSTRLELAVKLASEHKAHLTGLYLTHSHHALPGEALKAEAKQAEGMFHSKSAAADADAKLHFVDWAVTGDAMVETLNYYAHRKDLTIVGQTSQDRLPGNVPADLPERVVLGSGGPVLVVPYAGKFGTLGERVLVAWKGGRASGRALHDAMPFLIKAKQVFVVTVALSGDLPLPDVAEACDVLSHLQRHDVPVKVETLQTGEVPVDNVLMNFAWEHGCDLLVMGVHTKPPHGLRDIGPVAKNIFQHMTVPVLMSH